MSKEVTKKESTEMATMNNDFEMAGKDFEMSSNEIVIPKLILLQGQSPQVLNGEGNFGELMAMSDGRVFARPAHGKNDAKEMEFIPITRHRFWIEKAKVGDQWEFAGMIPITRDNENLNAFDEFERDGYTMKRVFLHLFYVLVPGEPLPYTLGFRGASKRAGDALCTQMYVVNKMVKAEESWKRSPFAKAMTLKISKESKNNNTFAVLLARVSRDATFEEAKTCLDWYKTIGSGKTKVDNSDIETEGKSTNYANEDIPF